MAGLDTIESCHHSPDASYDATLEWRDMFGDWNAKVYRLCFACALEYEDAGGLVNYFRTDTGVSWVDYQLKLMQSERS